jgi:hypothetical protein
MHATQTRISTRWTWLEQMTFDALKLALYTCPILINLGFHLLSLWQTDAFRDVVATILNQWIGRGEMVVAYASRTMLKAEKNSVVMDKKGVIVM